MPRNPPGEPESFSTEILGLPLVPLEGLKERHVYNCRIAFEPVPGGKTQPPEFNKKHRCLIIGIDLEDETVEFYAIAATFNKSKDPIDFHSKSMAKGVQYVVLGDVEPTREPWKSEYLGGETTPNLINAYLCWGVPYTVKFSTATQTQYLPRVVVPEVEHALRPLPGIVPAILNSRDWWQMFQSVSVPIWFYEYIIELYSSWKKCSGNSAIFHDLANKAKSFALEAKAAYEVQERKEIEEFPSWSPAQIIGTAERGEDSRAGGAGGAGGARQTDKGGDKGLDRGHKGGSSEASEHKRRGGNDGGGRGYRDEGQTMKDANEDKFRHMALGFSTGRQKPLTPVSSKYTPPTPPATLLPPRADTKPLVAPEAESSAEKVLEFYPPMSYRACAVFWSIVPEESEDFEGFTPEQSMQILMGNPNHPAATN